MSSPKSYFSHNSGCKVPLLVVLVAPIVLPVAVMVGLMGYLSVRNGQQSVDHLADQLATAASERIEQTVTPWLRSPAGVTRNNAAAIQLGILDWRNASSLQRYFEQQLEIFGSVDAIAVTDESGHLLAVEKPHNGSTITPSENSATSLSLPADSVQAANARVQQMTVGKGTALGDWRSDAWYQTAKATGKPTWQLITSVEGIDEPVLRAVNFQPFYDRTHTFRGVLAASVNLSQLNNFLKHLKIGKTGQAFVIEQSGLLVATADDKPLFHRRANVLKSSKSLTDIQQQAEPRRIKAVNSRDLLTQQVATSLVEQFGGFDRLDGSRHLKLAINHQRYFVHVEPLAKDQGLNWLAVVIVPEADFMDTIHSNKRLTFWLCAGALASAIVLGGLIASRIARPILRLSRASRELALGKWQHPIQSQSKIAELEILAHSFNQMTVHLQQSFDQVTTALQESEERFTKVFRTSPDAISIATLPERRYIEVNDRFLAITGYAREEVIGQTAIGLGLVVNSAQLSHFEHLIQTDNSTRDVEIDYRNKQGQLGTVLVSSEVIELEGQACLLCMYRDITIRKQAEEALRQSEQRFRNAFDTTAVGMALTAPSGHFLQVNASLCQMLGYTEAELLELTFPEITHPDDVATTLECAQKLLAGEISYYHLEKRYQHQNGHAIWCLLSVSLVRDRHQQPLYFVAQMQDITKQQSALDERQKAEIAIQTTNAQLSQRVAELSTLNLIMQSIANTVDLSTALKSAAALITDRFNACETGISLLNKQRTALRTVANHHLDPHIPSLLGVIFTIEKNDVATQLFEHRTSIVVTLADKNPITAFTRKIMQARNIQCLMLVSLQTRGDVVGMMSIAAEQYGRIFTADEVKLAETIAGQIVGAVHTTHLPETTPTIEATTTEATSLAKGALLTAMSHKLQIPFNAILNVVQRL